MAVGVAVMTATIADMGNAVAITDVDAVVIGADKDERFPPSAFTTPLKGITRAERSKVIGFHFVMVTIGATHHGWIERVAYSHAVGRGLSVCLHISD